MHLKPLQGSNIGLICKKELRLHSLEEEFFGGCVLFCQKNVYLVHLVGDAHQPLHVIEPLYKAYKTKRNPYGKTYGANSIKVPI
jgi:hypothetical protein